MTDFHLPAARLVAAMRTQKSWTRGQIARRLKCSVTVVYNIETGRTRVPFSMFLRLCDIGLADAVNVILRHMHSVESRRVLSGADVVRLFRTRLRFTQMELGAKLGYRSAAMIHHFEKGIREPSLEDFLNLMSLAGDNIRGLVKELTGDAAFAQKFPAGSSVSSSADWSEYWSAYYISAIRQIMRTTAYGALTDVPPGYFCRLLGIDTAQEQHALKILQSLNFVRSKGRKLEIDRKMNAVIPTQIDPKIFQELKMQWLEFGKKFFLKQPDENKMLSFDLLPVNREIYVMLVAKMRELQNELHNMKLENTDGFVQLGWMANYLQIHANKTWAG